MRTVVIDEALRTRLLRTIAQRKPVEVGALVGRQLPDGSRDFLLLAVALPLPQEKKRSRSEEKKEKEEEKEDEVAWRCLADVSRRIVESHVKRVRREGGREGKREDGREGGRQGAKTGVSQSWAQNTYIRIADFFGTISQRKAS